MLSGRSCSSSYDSDSSDDAGDTTDQDFDGSRKPIGRGRWTKDEDETLQHLIESYGSEDWKYIASFFTNRSELQCYHRWQKVLNPDVVKGPWTKEEDDRVIELVQEYGTKRWSLVSKHLIGRTGKQCRERWHNHLNPDIKKSAWTLEEDRVIYNAHKRLGNRWAEIAKQLPGRTDNAIKNHWNSTMKRKVEAHNPYTPIKQRPLDNKFTYIYPESIGTGTEDSHSTKNFKKTGQGVVRTLNPCHVNSSTNQNAPMSRWTSPDHLVTNRSADDSPMFWTAREDTVLTPMKNLPDFTDSKHQLWDLGAGGVSELEDFDLLASNDENETSIAGRGLSHKGSTGYHFDSRAISELSKENCGGLIPITSPVTSKFSTPPTILRKSRPKLRSRRSQDIFLSTTPKGTPIKSLPFSPSQFLNLDRPNQSGSSQQILTSTPIVKCHQATPKLFSGSSTPVGRYLQTPMNARRSLLDPAPRTPTPLKDALNALEKRSGTNKFMPCTPGQLKDITEIIRDDFGPDSGFQPLSADSPAKQVRKSLTQQLVHETDHSLSHFADDEQSQSLLSDSLLMSPSKAMSSFNSAFLMPASPFTDHLGNRRFRAGGHETPFKPPTVVNQLDKAWEKVACGKILRSCRPRSLNL